ncbi:hypothetical protein SRHO_G00212320 [Serrasalmus rhombeus]
MAALLARQHMLKEKHAVEEQEEQLRRKKEQLQLEADIAATVAKVNVLRIGSTVRSTTSRKSNGMESYFKTKDKTVEVLNADAETFVPQTLDVNAKGNITIGNAKPKVKTLQQSVKVEKPAPFLMGPFDPSTPCSTIPCLPLQQAACPVTSGNLLSIMEKQSELTSMLVYQQGLSSLPKREIPVFDGSPLHFHAFVRSFEQVIEAKTSNADDRLHYLAQYRGQPNELVKSCQHMSDGAGYVKAKTLLYDHFGNEHVIAAAYLNKVHSWPLIRSEDGKALQAYSLFLRGCCNAMEEVHGLSELNTPANMLAVIKKLPYKLKDKWRTVACDIQERQHCRATFVDIVFFLERQVKIATDPVFGNLCDIPPTHLPAMGSDGGKRPYPRAKGSSFGTTVTAFERKNQTEAQDCHTFVKICLFCKGGHMLESCSLLDKKPHDEKISFLKRNGICFGCLCTGHISKECRKRLSCKMCDFRHPSILHIHHKEKKEIKSDTETDNVPVTVQTSGLTGGRWTRLSLPLYQLSSKKSQRTVETYAFLDQGSSASFCTVGLLDKLNLAGRKTKILLRTMGQEKVVDSFIVTELEVAGLGSDVYCEMPDLFTQHRMPVNVCNIPKQQDLDDWPHLKHVYLPEIEVHVELLIGMNMPRALEPLEVVRSVGDGPFAIKTVLGWTVNGPLGRECCGSPGCPSTVTANRISAVTLDKLWKQQFKMDFPESSQDEQLGLSWKDSKFLRMASETVTLSNGHYSIALPLKDRDIRMPDNRAIVEQRALSLKRKFIREKDFHKVYTAFMEDLISRGYAQRVPIKDLERSDGKLASVASEEEAISLYIDLGDICVKGGFCLTKWISNSRNVLAVIPEDERAKEVKDLDLDCDILPVERALGVRWCVQSDAFKFYISIPDRPLTRRGILSTVSSFYDPLGFLAPVIFTAKKILQDLCQRGIGWDDTIPSIVAQEWQDWVGELSLLDNLSIR